MIEWIAETSVQLRYILDFVGLCLLMLFTLVGSLVGLAYTVRFGIGWFNQGQ